MKRLRERLRRLFQLPAGERLILAKAWMLFFLVELGLRALSFKRLMVFHRKLSSSGRAEWGAERTPSVELVVWLVEVAERYAPFGATCLKKALVLSWLLGRRGVATTLRIGVARKGEDLSAHAWLERNGVILGRPAGDGFEALFSRGEVSE